LAGERQRRHAGIRTRISGRGYGCRQCGYAKTRRFLLTQTHTQRPQDCTLWNLAYSHTRLPLVLRFMLSLPPLLLFLLVVLDVAVARQAHDARRQFAPSLRSLTRRQAAQNGTKTNSTTNNPNTTLASAGIYPLVLASDKQYVCRFIRCRGGLTEPSYLQDLLHCSIYRGCQLPCRNGHSVIRHLGCLLSLFHCSMQVSAQVPFDDVQQSNVRLCQSKRDVIQRKLRRHNQCVSVYPLCSSLISLLAASGFVAEEAISLGNITVPQQAFGTWSLFPWSHSSKGLHRFDGIDKRKLR